MRSRENQSERERGEKELEGRETEIPLLFHVQYAIHGSEDLG